MSYRKTNSGAAGVWLLIVCHLLIVLPLAYFLNIWSDEASSLYSTESVSAAFRNAATVERQAPLYFWILSLWRVMNASPFFARVLSTLFSVAAIWLFSNLASRVLKNSRTAILTTAFFALHPIMIWASVEIRVYALLILISIALLRLFIDAFFEGPEANTQRSQRTAKIGFLVVSIIALYTNYYLGFLLVGLFAALIVTARWRPAVMYLATMAAAGVAFAPLVLTLEAQFVANTTGLSEQPTLIEGIRRVWNHALTFVLPADIRRGEEATPVGLLRLWIVRAGLAGAAVLAALRWKRLSSITIALGAVVTTVSLCLLAAYFLVGAWLVELRHASTLFVPLILFVASLLSDLFGSKDEESGAFKYVATLAGVVVLGFFSYALMNLYPDWSKNGDWIRVAAYIQAKEKPGQPIIIFHTYDALVMPYEYHGVNRILPDERLFDFDFGTPTPERTNAKTEFTISKIPTEANEIWVIANDECKTPGICDQFEEFLNENYTVVEQRQFYRNNVTLLRRKVGYQ